jgi:hypothetical protein
VGQFEKCSGGCPQPLSVIIEKTAEDSRRYIINKIKLAHYRFETTCRVLGHSYATIRETPSKTFVVA